MKVVVELLTRCYLKEIAASMCDLYCGVKLIVEALTYKYVQKRSNMENFLRCLVEGFVPLICKTSAYALKVKYV